MKGHHSTFGKALLLLPLLLLFSCLSNDLEQPQNDSPIDNRDATFSYMALGDSYTVGESVSITSSFPSQLVTKLNEDLEEKIKGDVLASSGWRTDDLITAIDGQAFSSDYDIVTLLIGVNNQFQNRPFSQYETEFMTLLDKAITFAKGENDRVFVLSIPDYAYTPFSANSDRDKISTDIDAYNAYAEEQATAAGVQFVNITDITREGLNEPELVASDGLHPSGEAYRRFVERLLPLVRARLNQ